MRPVKIQVAAKTKSVGTRAFSGDVFGASLEAMMRDRIRAYVGRGAARLGGLVPSPRHPAANSKSVRVRNG